MKNLGPILRTIATYTVYSLAGLIPVFFLPITTEFFDTNKQFLVAVAAIILAIAFAAYNVTRKIVRITLSPALLAVLVYAAVLLLSTFIATPYPYEVLLGRGLFILSLTIIFLTGSSLAKAKNSKLYMYVLSGSGIVLTALTTLQNIGFGPSRLINRIPGLQIPNDALFNVAGSALIAVLFLLPVALANLVEMFATTKVRQKTIYGVISAILIAGIVVNAYFLLPGKVAQAVFLPFQASWSIAIDTLKRPTTALLGVGPESYTVAFTNFRPADLNLSQFWNVRFPSARIEILHTLTTMGILGLAAWVFMAVVAVLLSFPLRPESRPLSVILFTLLVIQLFYPANLVLTVTFYLTLLVLVLVRKAQKDSRTSDVLLQLTTVKIVSPETTIRVEKSASGILAYVVAGLVTALVLYGGYHVVNSYASENMFYQSLLALQNNDVPRAYQLQQNVVNRNIFSDRYHRAFASTNFAIASAIAQNPEADEQQQANIAPLVQEAVSQAKISTELDPRKTVNWESLAAVYRALVGSVQGADQFTIAAMVQAIQTDPTNPSLRFELGSVYLSLQNYDQATRLFQQSIELKPDWANAYYNLANAYNQNGNQALALDALRAAFQLLPADSADRDRLQAEIDALADQVERQTATQQTTQQTGQQGQGALSDEQIRLPEDLGLPEATPPSTIPETPEVSSTPTPSPVASPEPSPSQ